MIMMTMTITMITMMMRDQTLKEIQEKVLA